MFILYDFNYNTRGDLSLTSAEYCVGASPTAGIPTVDEVSDVSLCEDVELTLSSTFACRACSTMKAETAPLTESYQDGDYLEVFFTIVYILILLSIVVYKKTIISIDLLKKKI